MMKLCALISLCLFASQLARAELPKIEISERTAQPLVVADKPWEDFCLNYCQVLRDGATWHLWYGAYDHTYTSDTEGFLCYARSSDGIHFEKPALGLIDYHGSKANNVILTHTHGHSFFIDSSAAPDERF